MAELILALDLPDSVAAFRLLDRLPGVRWVKVGSILMTREGPDLVERLAERGLQVFLDLKWHDIPNTVAGAVRSARQLGGGGVRMVTVHALGGSAMMAAASEAAEGALSVVAVTVLTSHSAGDYAAALGRPDPDLGEEALRQARHARRAGLHGVVCSPHEVATLRASLGPEPLLVVPGIRREGDDPGDQARVASPARAVADGATHLVIGRAVLRADDPEAAWEAIRAEAASAGSQAA